jgi:hypothetical protein
MSVLTLRGTEINWNNPPAATTRVMWSRRDQYGRQVTGSLRTIAHLDYLDYLCVKKFGVHLVVMQPPYNEGVEASKYTHDYDACLDVWIPGVSGNEQQRFFRANGAGAYLRTPAQGFVLHIHYFTLPPFSVDPSKGYWLKGFKVGLYVDGGWSLHGRRIASSQIEDYYNHRTALSGHAYDPSWFPGDTPGTSIASTIFDLNAYIARKAGAMSGPDELADISSHGPLARLGGEAGQELWETWEGGMRGETVENIRRKVSVIINSDTNKHGALPDFGPHARRIGGKGIDLIAFIKATGGARLKVLRHKRVDLHIDRHDCYGVKVRVTFPSGKRVTYWDVQANLGRGVGDDVFRRSCQRIYKAFGNDAVYHFNEIDEADKPEEKRILVSVFGKEHFRWVAGNTMCPVLVGRSRFRVVRDDFEVGSPGLAKVSPHRVVVETILAPK